MGIDENFIFTSGREIEKGRNLNLMEIQSYSHNVVIGKLLADELFEEREDPIGKIIYKNRKSEETSFTIIGVIKDFHLFSLHQEMGPLVLFNNKNFLNSFGEYLSVRISGDIQENLKEIVLTKRKKDGKA